MDPPPQPPQRSSPKRSARVYPGRSREQASGSTSAAPSSPESSPGTPPTTKAQRSPSYIAPSSPDELLPSRSPGYPVRASPQQLTTETAAHSPPDDLLFAMPRGREYELVSSESTSSPRTMSQVSPGFIFVNFLGHPYCFGASSPTFSRRPKSPSFSCFLSPISLFDV